MVFVDLKRWVEEMCVGKFYNAEGQLSDWKKTWRPSDPAQKMAGKL